MSKVNKHKLKLKRIRDDESIEKEFRTYYLEDGDDTPERALSGTAAKHGTTVGRVIAALERRTVAEGKFFVHPVQSYPEDYKR
jgi:hypothetical protein